MARSGHGNEARRYQRLFWWSALRHLPHHGSVILAHKLPIGKLHELMSRKPHRQLKDAKVKRYPEQSVAAYEKSMQKTKLWHGSGRYQYVNGKVADILGAIVANGSLKPVADQYALLVGGKATISISTTPLRMIARSYADMHGKGKNELNRYGSSLWWVAYYYGVFYAQVFTRYGIVMARNWRRWNRLTADHKGERAWGKKVNTRAETVWDVFGMGSDIPGNYPILFGIARYTRTAQLPKTLAKTEVRLTRAVRIADLSHVEVPEAKMNEAKALFTAAGYSVPVYAMELGEYVASKQPFARLLGIEKIKIS